MNIFIYSLALAAFSSVKIFFFFTSLQKYFYLVFSLLICRSSLSILDENLLSFLDS